MEKLTEKKSSKLIFDSVSGSYSNSSSANKTELILIYFNYFHTIELHSNYFVIVYLDLLKKVCSKFLFLEEKRGNLN
jgi:hypothetical protein